jgi:large subunit ribosomal protein L25
MAEIVTISAEKRDRAGKGAARETRRSGRVPAVIYGDGKEPVLISLEPRALVKELQKPGFFAKILNVQVDGETHRTLPRDVQLDPVKDTPLHADFLRVGATTRLTVAIPVQFINQEKAPGIRRGGLLNVVRHEIEMVVSADNIPQYITVDLEGYDIGDSIHINEVTLPAGVKPAITRDFTVASVAPPTVVREESAAAAAAAATGGAPAEGEAAAPAAAAAKS